jgi:hypothetical protein
MLEKCFHRTFQRWKVYSNAEFFYAKEGERSLLPLYSMHLYFLAKASAVCLSKFYLGDNNAPNPRWQTNEFIENLVAVHARLYVNGVFQKNIHIRVEEEHCPNTTHLWRRFLSTAGEFQTEFAHAPALGVGVVGELNLEYDTDLLPGMQLGGINEEGSHSRHIDIEGQGDGDEDFDMPDVQHNRHITMVGQGDEDDDFDMPDVQHNREINMVGQEEGNDDFDVLP